MSVRLVLKRKPFQRDLFDPEPIVEALLRVFAPERFTLDFSERGSVILTPVKEAEHGKI